MKKLPILLLAAAGCFAVTSCSQDDDSNSLSSDLTGTYEITSMTIAEGGNANAQDYDDDGDSHTNLVLEGTCTNDSWISFHDDGTFDEGYSYTTTSNGGMTLSCETEVSSGTYTKDGNTVTTMSGGVTKTFEFNSSSHTISRTDNDRQYIGWHTLNSLWTSFTSDFNIAYKKYTDNDDDNGQNDDDDDNLD